MTTHDNIARSLAAAALATVGALSSSLAMAQDCFIGEVRYFAGNFAPRDWALANGQMMQIAQYQALFSILGTTYGGDGRVTFAVPDLRGRAPLGVGQGQGLSNYVLGQKIGAEQVTLSTAQLPAHTHAATTSLSGVSVTAKGQGAGVDSATPEGTVWGNTGRTNIYSTSAPNVNMNPAALALTGTASTSVAATGGSQPVSVVQPSVVLTPVICVNGIYPSRP